ncbi:protein translocase subunit SecD [Aquipuribacter nitratireducens]|uniref:Protein translocase subunit SecD n=1 Tax=Aquipuribacter nitratireducens TaxID=650104 RepID=A0ABW0GR48_9MICO
MTTTTRRSRPRRALVLLAVIVALVFGTVTGGYFLDDARWSPSLALDLEGGTQVVLTPVAEEGAEIPSESIDQAVEIIRQRVNGTGVTEAEVVRQGSSNIVVSIPGQADEETLDLVRASAQLEFRPVLLAGTGVDPSLFEPSVAPSGDPSAPVGEATAPAAEESAVPSAGPADATAEPSVAPSAQGRAVPRGDVADALAAAPTGEPTGAPTAEPVEPVAEPTAEPVAEPAVEPTDASDPAYLTPEVLAEFEQLSCLDPETGAVTRVSESQDDEPLVVCSQDGFEKYVLGPVEVEGENVADAGWGFGTGQTGLSTGQIVVDLQFDGTGTDQFADVSRRLFDLTGDRNRFGIVLDGVVISAPTMNGIIPNGQAQISGNFTQETAEVLANQLRYGALPLSFTVESTESISATLGDEQLRLGVLAGLIGLGLVVVYMLVQYRALGLVTIASLAIAGLLAYGLLLLFSWRQGYRLSLPGVVGLIVAIGITADSFIIFFERIRDEIRDGRSVAVAIERGWERSLRTILISDTVSLLAAVVLYTVSVGGVRGFAFTLGLTTVIDLIVVVLFTKPVVTLLSRTRFFGEGHTLSGFDAEHLGSVVARNAIRSGTRGVPTGTTVAERKRAAAAANEGAVL